MIRRRTLLAAALPTAALAQSDTRPSLAIAVQKIANTGTLEPLREQSSNASEHYLAALLETPIAREPAGFALGRIPGLATAWRRIDERTVELSPAPERAVPRRQRDDGCGRGVELRAGADVRQPRCPRISPPSPAATGPRWTGWRSTGPLTVRFVNAKPDVTMEGRLSAGGSEIISPRSFRTPLDCRTTPVRRWGRGPTSCATFQPDVSLVLDCA